MNRGLLRSQLVGLLWLRWRLMRNQFLSRGRRAEGVIGVLVLVAMLVIGLTAMVGSFLLGRWETVAGDPETLALVWHGMMAVFSLLWLIGLFSELQRSEAIDMRKLLHLPVSLKAVFALNFIASLASPWLAFFAPSMAGFALGVAWHSGPLLLAVVPLWASVLLAVAAWTYTLRGWLVTLMENKSRRRNILTAGTMAIVLLSQAPSLVNLYGMRNQARGPKLSDEVRAFTEKKRAAGVRIQDVERLSEAYGSLRRTHREALADRRMAPWTSAAEVAASVVPLGWPGLGAVELGRGRVGTVVLGTLAGLLLTLLALSRGWRATWRHYTASATATARPQGKSVAVPRRRNAVAWRLRGVPDDIAAMALASFFHLVRELRFKVAILWVPLLGLMLLLVRGGGLSRSSLASFAPASAASLAFLGVLQFATNLFGSDRDGFRALMLLPTPRARLLAARNLALLPVTLTIGVCFLAAAAILYRIPALAVLTGLILVLTAHVLMSVAGNLYSVLLPMRISATTLSRTRTGAGTALLSGLLHLALLPVIMLVLALPAGVDFVAASFLGLESAALMPIVALVCLAAALGAYVLALPGQGRLLASREQLMLATPSRSVE